MNYERYLAIYQSIPSNYRQLHSHPKLDFQENPKIHLHHLPNESPQKNLHKNRFSITHSSPKKLQKFKQKTFKGTIYDKKSNKIRKFELLIIIKQFFNASVSFTKHAIMMMMLIMDCINTCMKTFLLKRKNFNSRDNRI